MNSHQANCESSYQLQTLQLSGMQDLFDLCDQEGWNPGIGEGASFLALDPQGLHCGRIGETLVSAIFAMRHNENLAHIGSYIVAKQYRGKGYGLSLFEKALESLGNRIIGLEGVLDREEDYKKFGFNTLNLTSRVLVRRPPPMAPSALDLVSLKNVTINELAELDSRVFTAFRENFLKEWVRIPGSDCIAAIKNSKIVGFGCIHPGAQQFKLGPVIAPNAQIAANMIGRLFENVCANSATLDLCHENEATPEIIRLLQAETLFSTVRMYRGSPPNISWQECFGLASLEVG